MKKITLRSGLMATTTICGAILSTMAVPALVTMVATMLPSAAEAQDYTSGAVQGSVKSTAGAAVAGATITLTSSAQGQTRTFTSNGNGSFSGTGLAPGEYSVVVTAKGYTDFKGSATVVVAQESRIIVDLQAVGSTQTVVVRGHRARQDFTKTTTGITVDVDTLTSQMPIARSVTAVTMLAPTAIKGVPGFGDVASLGGSSVAENAYYINGLNITNPDTYVGSAKVPFDFYKTIQVQTGGYAAEFGRATGGVVNAVTKNGTNEFMFAVHGNFSPASLSSTSPNTASNIGKDTKNDTESVSVEAGGPIIKDHLFAYGLYQANDNVYKAGGTSGSYSKGTEKDPFYGAKIDGYITSTQHLELTYFNTKSTDNVKDFAYGTNSAGDYVIGAFSGAEKNVTGGENWVAKYTGKVTDWFTLSGAYGVSKDENDTLPTNVSAYYVLDYRPASLNPVTGAPKLLSAQPFQQNEVDETQRKFYRLDGDVTFDLVGHHHVRFGTDHEDNSETKVLADNGTLPIYIRYDSHGIRYRYERLGGQVAGKNTSYYLQDSWDITSTLNLQIGVRDDDFHQFNLSGQEYLTLKNNLAPRIGFAWDPTGDNVFKITGSYGVYYIPPAMNLGFRGKDLYFGEYFAYPTGTSYNGANGTTVYQPDPTTGLPTTVGAAITTLGGSGYASACPVDLSAAPGHPVNGAATCVIYGGGIQDPASAKMAVGAKATYENEAILGASWRINDLWTVGMTGTYRELKRVSEDTDFSPYLYDYYGCGAATPPAANAKQCDFYGNNSAYYIWNPGSKTQTVVDWYGATQGQKTLVTLTNLPFPKPKRTYSALTIDWKRAFDGKWGLQGSLVLSRSYGNYEGTVKSDAGNGAQTDAGSTQDFDYVGLTDYSTGLLPNHHGIVLKSWASYAITPEFLVGANLLVQSPMHGSCEGYNPTDANAAGYGASSFYCNGLPAPRGTGWKSDWEKNIDLSFRYTVPGTALGGKKLVLRADIFNIFDTHDVLQRYAQHESSPGVVDAQYLSPTEYQAPRTMRVGFDFNY